MAEENLWALSWFSPFTTWVMDLRSSGFAVDNLTYRVLQPPHKWFSLSSVIPQTHVGEVGFDLLILLLLDY